MRASRVIDADDHSFECPHVGWISAALEPLEVPA